MTSMDSELVAAAALLGFSKQMDVLPSKPSHDNHKALEYSSSTVFRSLAPDAHCSNTAPSSPSAVSFSASSMEEHLSVSSSGSSLDGYTSETTTMTNQQQFSYCQPVVSQEQEDAFAGTTISLALPQDAESLSPLHCFMRKYCVEAFSATEQDLSTPRYGKSHSGRVSIGQVGIRCIHCKHLPAKLRAERAVCFPSSLKNIYHSIETWQRRHSVVCRDLPVWIKASMTELMKKSRAGAGGRRQYWEESARLLGMETTANGVRFVRVPGDIGSGGELASQTNTTAFASFQEQGGVDESPSVPIVYEQDKALVTNYLYKLMSQMETCSFTEQDRSGGRSKVKDCPTGMPGMQCKHCRGKAGFGRYFPTSVNALASANSDRNIFNHISKCRVIPETILTDLKRLQKEQAQVKNKRGQRKEFFERVWTRLYHGAQQQQSI